VETRLFQLFRIFHWTETNFSLDPISLLRVQNAIEYIEREQRRANNSSNALAVHIR